MDIKQRYPANELLGNKELVRFGTQGDHITLKASENSVLLLMNGEPTDPNDAIMLLIDHQSGLFQLVRDMEQP